MSANLKNLLPILLLDAEGLGAAQPIKGAAVAQGFAGELGLAEVLQNHRLAWDEVPELDLPGLHVSRAAEHPWILSFERADGGALHCEGGRRGADGSLSETTIDLRGDVSYLVQGEDGAGALIVGGAEPVAHAVAAPRVEIPMKHWHTVAGDPWLAQRVIDLGPQPGLFDAALLAGDLIRLAPRQPLDLEALLAGRVSSPMAHAVHPWVAALSAAQCARLQASVDAEVARLDAEVDPLVDRADSENTSWCSELAAWLSTRDALASTAWVVSAAGHTVGTALDDLDARHRASLLGLVDLPHLDHERLDRARGDDEAWWAEVFP